MKHLKEEFDRLTFKEVIVYTLAIASVTAGIVAIFLSLYIEPRGEIHPSVLTYFGISSAFCGSLLGISAHYSNELARFKTMVMTEMSTKKTE